jgi:hypothetical protein
LDISSFCNWFAIVLEQFETNSTLDDSNSDNDSFDTFSKSGQSESQSINSKQLSEDEFIDEKFDSWKEVFASMLVQRAFKTNGLVKDCSIVMEKSNEYRQSQDYISEFVNDRIIRDPNGQIKKTELNSEFNIWHGSNYGGKAPSPKEIHEYMDKEFGKQRGQIWHGVKINYDREKYDNDNSEQDTVDEIDENEL